VESLVGGVNARLQFIVENIGRLPGYGLIIIFTEFESVSFVL
jgi:hypothetical protein